MSEYKHGDWYCKPANEAEAHEIVERAVASGAELFDSVGNGKLSWDFLRYWGVYEGYTDTRSRLQSVHTKKYTIEQVREKFPMPSVPRS